MVNDRVSRLPWLNYTKWLVVEIHCGTYQKLENFMMTMTDNENKIIKQSNPMKFVGLLCVV